jgi:rRNA-processing protein FCF1
MPKRPTTDQLDTAIAWLRANEGDQGEAGRCAAVADYLEAVEQDAMIKQAARKAGVPVSMVRKRLQGRA